MRLTVIGSSPAWPNAGGAHSGYHVASDGKRLLLDCGPGVLGRLREHEQWPLLESIVDIPTDAGVAHGYVLPAPRDQFTTLLSLVLGAFFELPTVFRLDGCAVDPSATAAVAACTAAPQTEI